MLGSRESDWVVIQRCIQILVDLQRGPQTKDDLSCLSPGATIREHRIVENRFKKDLQRLRNRWHCDIRYNRKTRTYTLHKIGFPLVGLPDDLLPVIALLRETFVEDTPMAKNVQRLLKQLIDLIPPNQQRKIPTDPPLRLNVTAVDGDDIPNAVLDKVQYACRHHYELEFDYYSPAHADGQPRINHVQPIAHLFEDEHHYLQAYCLRVIGPDSNWERRQIVRYRLGRIRNLKRLPSMFVPSSHHHLYRDLIYVLSSEIVRGGVSKRFPNSKVTILPDGRARVEARSLDLFRDVRRLLRYGANCQVIGGDEAVQITRNLVSDLADLYTS